jgi:hypothetical protein
MGVARKMTIILENLVDLTRFDNRSLYHYLLPLIPFVMNPSLKAVAFSMVAGCCFPTLHAQVKSSTGVIPLESVGGGCVGNCSFYAFWNSPATPVTTPDGCTTWSSSYDYWIVTHGAPAVVNNGYYPGKSPAGLNEQCYPNYGIHMLHEYGGNPDYPNFNGGSGIMINQGFQQGVTYSIRVLFQYDENYYPVSAYPQQGWLRIYAGGSNIPTGDLAHCREVIPMVSGLTSIESFPFTSTSDQGYDLLINYYASVSSSYLWIYPEGYDKYTGQNEANPQIDVYLSNVFICQTCPSGTDYWHSGTLPLTASVGAIYAGTSTIDGGTGTGTISNQAASVSTWTAGNFIELDPGFIGTASGSGSLALNISPCPNMAQAARFDLYA